MSLRERWNNLEARERRTLTVGAVALAVILYVFVIWLPAHRNAEALEERLAQQRVLLAWMQQAAAEAQTLKGATGGVQRQDLGDQNLFSFIDKNAREAGLGEAIRQVEPTNDQRVRVSLQRASFDTVIGWLANLKMRYGVEVNQLGLRRGADPGLVDVQLVLEGPAQ
jgi:general secretion pathway protein M